jgi:hypothetical protein
MKQKWFTIVIPALIVVSLVVTRLTAQDDASHTALPELDCSECHTCTNPTASNMCLKMCPSLTIAHKAVEHNLKEAPDSLLLREIADLYKPVQFSHKLHAEMAEMGGGCAICHHYSPPGKIPPCRECHGAEGSPNNLRQPALKGAYHRRCMGCHREWSHDTKCIVCHLPEPGKAMAATVDSTDIMGISHPKIMVPVTKVYHTEYDEGPVVTFHHKEHIDLFDLTCVSCHQDENCGYCHDLSKGERPVTKMDDGHDMCSNCHDLDNCSECHGKKEKPVFSHASTGWPLSGYHQKLDCRACHPTGKKISRLSRHCNDCHGGWNQDNFSHTVTGLKLDEIHVEMDCSDCHTNRNFEAEPNCSDCHDDGRTHKDAPPGKIVR